MRWSLLLVCVIVFPAVAAPLPATADDVKLLQGTWMVVAFDHDGKKLPEEEAKKMMAVIKDDTLTLGDGKREEQVTFTLDQTKKPKTMDLRKKGDNEAAGLCIYELDGDTLKLCWNKPGKERPTAFDATKVSGLAVMKRKK